MLTAIVIISIMLEAVAVVFAVTEHCRVSMILMALSVAMLAFASLFFGLPLETQCDKNLWYTFLLSTIALLLYCFYSNKWTFALFFVPIAVFTLKAVFGQSAILVPTLRSGWLLPHVALYISSYLLITAAFVLSVAECFNARIDKHLIDDSLSIGFAFYSLALLIGMVWAKQAWGCFWSFDPKETWSLATWVLLLVANNLVKSNSKWTVGVLSLAYVCLHVCWWGVNLMPWASSGLHVY